MLKKLIAAFLALSMVVLPLTAFAEMGSIMPNSTADNLPLLNTVSETQTVNGEVYGQPSDNQTVSADVYGQPSDLEVQIQQLKQKLQDALDNNRFIEAAKIMTKIRELEGKANIESKIDKLKEEVMNYIQNDQLDKALEVLKEIIRNEHSKSDYKFIGKLYHQMKKDKVPHIFANGNEVQSDVSPIIKNDRTLIPLRAVANAIGIDNKAISWNQHNQTVNIKTGNINIYLPINSPQVTVNGKAQRIDVPATMYNNRVMVPLRAISQLFNKPVNWYPEGQIATVGD